MFSVLEGHLKPAGDAPVRTTPRVGKPLAYAHQDNLPGGVPGTPGMTAVMPDG
jgi:hypothetical protein